ncbi:unnamed protein product [Cuscuta europaea]|uniref:RRM domain-containing protein n=1 Tax=Cuscuta europaea TaxID=41803 RepID=A0A9P0ZKX4_CUSEU|nr:unnamed protein product [Cuscuta europaea]
MARKRKLESEQPNPKEESEDDDAEASTPAMARKRKLESEERNPKEESEEDDAEGEGEGEEEGEEEEVEEVEEVEEEESDEEEEGEESEDEEEVEEEESKSDSDSSENGEGDESSKREKIRKLLEPLAKDQIIVLLKEAASNDPSLLSRVTQLATTDPTHRKIFIHGLSWDTTADTLRASFSSYGEIEECRLITDKVTGKAKGYAFVLYKTRSSAKKALKQPQKKIGSRTISCQLAALGSVGGSDVGSRKIYVGNVGPNISAENIRSFFSRYGEIEEGPSGFDPLTHKPRGFAIFVYKTAEGAKKVLEEPIKFFEGCQLNCKKFVEYPNNKNSNNTPVIQPLQQTDYGIGMKQGMFMGQSPGMGLTANALLGLASPAIGGASVGGNYGLGTLSPSVIGNFGQHMGMQGLGAYQNSSMLPSSSEGTSVGPVSSQPPNTQTYFPSYMGR